MIPWSPLPPETTLAELGDQPFVVFGDGDLVFGWTTGSPMVGRYRQEDVYLITARARSFGGVKRRWMPGHVTLRAVSIAAGVLPEQILAVPQIVPLPFGRSYVLDGDRHLGAKELLEHGPPASVRHAAALAQVEKVKELYGRMLADVAYRIENSALFDSAVATSRDFDTALAMWADLDTDKAPEAEVVRVSGLVKVTFDTARAHAETIGLAHLPAQSQAEARRAAKAARLAGAAATEAERTAAQEQVVRILTSLALYYLPAPESLGRSLPRPADGR